MPTIEQLIQQSKFRNEKHKAIISVMYVANLISSHNESVLKNHNITTQQYNVLRILRGQNLQPVTINLIKERMLDKSSDASRIVERLRKVGLTERVVCENDRRAVDVIITKKGLNVLSQIDKELDVMDKPVKHFTEKEAKALNILMQKFLDALCD